MDIIAIVNGAIEAFKKLKDASGALKDAETKLLLAEVYEKLADLKMEATRLQEENHDVRAQLKEALAPPTMVLRNGVYNRAENGDGPFCTNCFDDRRKAIRLVELGYLQSDFGKWRCPSCKTSFLGGSE